MYGINSILYQRGIYPPESFTRVQKYGLTLLVTSDEKLKDYLNPVIAQIKGKRDNGEMGIGSKDSNNKLRDIYRLLNRRKCFYQYWYF